MKYIPAADHHTPPHFEAVSVLVREGLFTRVLWAPAWIARGDLIS